jgi:hypothetical protein
MCLESCIDNQTCVPTLLTCAMHRQSKAARGSSDEQQAPQLLASLPNSTLSHIAQLCLRWHVRSFAGFGSIGPPPLLAVSRICRDSVLSNVHGATLGLPWHPRGAQVPIQAAAEAKAKAPALSRLLNRTCSLAPPGLNLTLNLARMPDVLPQLLEPGINCGGWIKVHSLKVGTRCLNRLARGCR